MTSASPLLHLLLLIALAQLCLGSRKLTSLYEPPANLLTFHHGSVLQGNIPISILWYGSFTPSQKSIVSDFFISLTPTSNRRPSTHSVAQWWNTIDNLYIAESAAKKPLVKKTQTKTNIQIISQVFDEQCSIGKSLTKAQISNLAAKAGAKRGGIAVVLTAQDVDVEGFCMSSCGTHGSDLKSGSAYIWVGNSATKCPGKCAWPFHQPIYGPQGPALIAPNGDVGVDGMVINLATMVAGTVTNPFGDGFYQGPKEAPLEAATACPGVYGTGAYPGYAGALLMDASTGASYNANGANGSKFLLPGLFDPLKSSCSTLV